jgi:YHS domain-containing protein
MRAAVVLVETGAPVVLTATNAVAVNTNCPVTGKPVDRNKTTRHEGRLVAFCCDTCKATFEKDPKSYLAKLGLPAAAAEKKASQPDSSGKAGGTN